MGSYEYDPLGAPLAMDNTKGAYYFQNDRQGSVTAVYDAAGTENYAYTYGPWGATKGTASITGGQTSPFGFTGQYKDPSASNWLYLRDRTYNYTTGRFNTTDPEPTSPGSPNPSAYAYANNDPINQSDPSGRCPLCISAGIGAVIGGVVEGGIYSWQHRNDRQFSWGGFAEATGRGAVIGGLAGALMPGAGNAVVRGLGLTGGRALATSTGVNAAVGAGFSWGVNTALCRPTDPWDLVLGAAGGGASSLIGPALNWMRGLWTTPRPVGAANAARGAALGRDLATAELANEALVSLRSTGRLPSNYVTKAEAEAQGWEPGKALGNKVPGGQIGGDVFENSDGILPAAEGRIWYEADIGINNMMKRSKQPGTRLVYSNDGLAFVTSDHYDTFYQIPNWK